MAFVSQTLQQLKAALVVHEVLFHWRNVVDLVILLVNWVLRENWLGVAVGSWTASMAEVLHHATTMLLCTFVQLLIEIQLPFALGSRPIFLSLWSLLPVKLASA